MQATRHNICVSKLATLRKLAITQARSNCLTDCSGSFRRGLNLHRLTLRRRIRWRSSDKSKRAIQEYRAALQVERDFPNVRTNAWLDFGWLVVEKQLTDFYEEVSQVLQEFREEGGLKFPATEYRYAAIQALLAEARGEMSRRAILPSRRWQKPPKVIQDCCIIQRSGSSALTATSSKTA